ncbi:MAG: recombinase family protein [Lachnospiraceae bacterium]|nr:recombinase family protein [Lachnospiraceae bacterium]
MEAKDFYNVAVYLRLSRDDEPDNGSAESNSIRSQRDMIRSYIRKQEDMEIYDIYVDDGWTGANFDRPSFKRMMEDIEAGHIDCVIVKDLSRFGRDYIEAGRLVQKVFPAFSVRFIALNDNFDSLTADFNGKMLVLPVKNFVNDTYCSDISKKVRSHQQVKRERGDFIGAFAVYGYRKDMKNINHLLIDEYAARIVRKIFAWKIEGLSNIAIAEKLDGMGVFPPMEYKKSQGEKFSTGFVTNIKTRWSAVAVKRILTNELYTGMMVQGKSEKASHKVKRPVEKPREEWVRVADTHEAVVAAEDFEIVQKLLAVDTRASAGKAICHMFTGFLFCGDCGKPMIRRVNRYKGTEKVYFICSTRNKGLGCTRHSIPEEELEHLVLSGLQQQLALFLDKSHVLEQIGQIEIQFAEIAVFDKEIRRLREEQEKYMSLRTGLYEDLKQGIITETDFRDFGQIYETQFQEAEEAVRRQEEALRNLFQAGVSAGAGLEKMKSTLEITELDRDVLVTFVSRILVYEDKRVFLELRAKDMFTNVLMLAGFTRNNENGNDGCSMDVDMPVILQKGKEVS